jgi:hypothetical protein
MNDYSITLFLHIVGALGFFVALGLEWTGLSQIRSARSLDQVRAWMSILKNVRKVGFVSMLTTVVTGVYLMLTAWGGQAWILVTLGSLVLLIGLAQAVTAPRMAAIGQALVMGKGSLSTTFNGVANRPLLSASIHTRMAIALGIVFLKIAKPDLGGSLLTIGVAIVLGLATTLYMPRRERVQAKPAD